MFDLDGVPTHHLPCISHRSSLRRHRLPHALMALCTLMTFGAPSAVLAGIHSTEAAAPTVANPQQAAQLSGIQVVARIPDKSASVTKTRTPILAIPQSISVITAAQMQRKGIQGIEEAMWYIAGTGGGAYGFDARSNWLLVRGFQPARYLDGLALADGSASGITRIEPWGLERLEVLKGPSSMVYGAMPPGGMINMVSKRPTTRPLHDIQVRVGSFNLREAAFDFGGPLDRAGQFLYRLTGLARNGDTQVDYIDDDRYYFAPALTWRPDDATTLTVLGRWQKAQTASGAGFLPAAGTLLPNPNGPISSSLFTGEPGQNDYAKTIKSLGYEFTHQFADGLAFTQNLRIGKVDVEPSAGIGAFGLMPDQHTLIRYLFPTENHTQTFGLDNYLQYDLPTGPVDHTLLAGLSYRRVHDRYASAFVFGAPPLDAYHPVYGSPITVPDYTSRSNQVQEQTGVYVQDQARIGHWLLTLGGRLDRVHTRTEHVLAGHAESQNDQEFSGRAGLSYLFGNGLATYVSWAHSFQPTVGSDFAGHPFQPTTGNQVEAGIKYQPIDGRALVTLALYQITQNNSLTIDPNHTLYQVQQGQTRLRGVELEGRWNITRQFGIHGDYTLSLSKITRTNDLPTLGARIPLLPLHQAALGVYYEFASGPLAGLGFHAGARYVGKHYGDAYNQWRTPAYTLLDAGISYQAGPWHVQLDANNLSDKRYISACNSAAWCYYGYPRKVTLSAGYRW